MTGSPSLPAELATMRYFIIVHRPTGHTLPHVGRGSTHAEPCDPAVIPPRLFTSAGSAKAALTWWLKGKTSVTRTSGGYPGEWDYDERWATVPVEGRVAEDMSVVQLVARIV